MMKMKMVDSNDAIIVTYVTMTKKGPNGVTRECPSKEN